MRRPVTSRLLAVVTALISLVAVTSLVAEVGTEMLAEVLAVYAYGFPL